MLTLQSNWRYSPPWWLRGGHAQTIWSARVARHWPAQSGKLYQHLSRAGRSTDGGVISGWREPPLPTEFAALVPHWRRERWTTPDEDFIDVDYLLSTGAALAEPSTHKKTPIVVMFHGLEGSRHSHYAYALAHACSARGWGLVIPHFRGCSGELNLGPRAYHSGDYAEIDWVLRRVANEHPGVPIVALGYSLGGNALMRWAGEFGVEAGRVVRSVASVCAPLDLVASGQAIGKGVNKLLYTRMFLASMQPKAKAKWAQYPNLFNLDAALDARTILEFDNAFTAPVHGFKHVLDYWSRASAKPHMRSIAVPSLVINAKNDPFVPIASVPNQSEVADAVTVLHTEEGGHVGFAQPIASRKPPGHIAALPNALLDWFSEHLSLSITPTNSPNPTVRPS
jgi:uncharacterized protein